MTPESLPPERRPLWFRLLRGLFFTVVVLVTLIALLWAEENWRGERQWQALVKSYEAKGDLLNAIDATRLSIPDDQNVAMTPLLRPLTDYDVVNGKPVWRDPAGVARLDALRLPNLVPAEKKSSDGRTRLDQWQSTFRSTNLFPVPATPVTPASDVLAGLGLWKSELDELEVATRRPNSTFQPGASMQISDWLIPPQLAHGKAISQILQLRCAARLAMGDTDGALADIEFNERWAGAIGGDPLLINQLVVIAMETIGTKMAWEGLTDHRWNDAQLRRLQAMFAARTPREDMLRALRGERAFGLAIQEEWIRSPGPRSPMPGEWLLASPFPRGLPRGWVRQNQISLVRLHELLAGQPGPGTVGQPPVKAYDAELIQQLKRDRPWFYSQLTVMLAPALTLAMAKEDRVLTTSRMAEIACGLERYRLVHQAYPDTLDPLSPDYLTTLPPDPYTRKPFQYARTGDGSFRLYSLGPDRRDDGGRFDYDDTKTDWPWPPSGEASKRMF